MLRYGSRSTSESPVEFEITRVDCMPSGHIWTENAQISLGFCTVWSGLHIHEWALQIIWESGYDYRLDTNSRTLSDEKCATIFDSSVNESQQRPVYSRRSLSNAFSSTSWSWILRKWKKSTKPSGKNVCCFFVCFFIVWPNLHNNFLIERWTISAKYMYLLKIWQVEKYM